MFPTSTSLLELLPVTAPHSTNICGGLARKACNYIKVLIIKILLLTNQIYFTWLLCVCVCAVPMNYSQGNSICILQHFPNFSALTHIEKTVAFVWNMSEYANRLMQLEVTDLGVSPLSNASFLSIQPLSL